jgi:class 3 adenylate cyclase/streptogramin lyase
MADLVCPPTPSERREPWNFLRQRLILGAGEGLVTDLTDRSDAGGSPEVPEEIRAFLIADVRGYTLFTQERGDEAAAKLAAKFAQVAREGVEARAGRVIELRGDEALCVFASPRQAIRAAVELQDRFVDETLADPALPLGVGIGLDAGEAVPVEGGYRGGALNLAARLCGQAGPGQILASREITHLARRVEGVTYADRGEVTFRGLADPVRVIEVSSETGPASARLAPILPKREPSPPPAPPPRRIPRRVLIASLAFIVVAVAIIIPAVLLGGGGPALTRVEPNSVGRIDPSEGVFVETIAVGEDPTGVGIGEDGDVWVINQGDSTVNRIDPGSGEVTPAKSTLGIPTGIAAGEGAVWITNGFGSQIGTQVVRIDPADDSVEVAFASGNAKAIAVAFGSIWLADADRDRVLRYDPRDLSAEPTEIPTDEDQDEGAAPRFLAVGSGAASGIWVVNELGDTVIRIEAGSNEVVDRIQVDSPTAVAADDSGVWVTSEANDRVHRFDPVGGRTMRSFQHADGIPDGPTAIVTGPNGAWVGSGLETAVVRIDPSTNAIARLPLGGITDGLAVDGNGDVWVTVRAQLV